MLRAGELLAQFIEDAACREAEFRAKQSAALRVKKTSLSADKGVSLQLVEELLKGMERRALEAQSRILEAVEAKSNRTAR